jgi:dTDP-4-dehydrorhamnose reductase
MIKILVLGSSGMAGHVVTTFLSRNKDFDVFNLTDNIRFNDRTIILDVTEKEYFTDYLASNHFDIIINCIGILNQYADEYKDKAVYLNSYLPHFLEYKYKNSATRIIHLSTDCVFSGKTGGYIENSFRDGDTFYDRTKSVGEIVNEKDLTFRTSIIGPDLNPQGIGLFNWFMNSTGNVNGYVNAIWSGVTTIQLAKSIEIAVLSDIKGLYHLVPVESISKYNLLLLLQNEFRRSDIIINQYENIYVDKSLVNTRKDFNFNIPGYQAMIMEMRQWIEQYQSFYPQYINLIK